MDKDKVLDELKIIETAIGVNFPDKYKQFLSEEVKDTDAYEIQTGQGDTVYLYNYKDLVERNETYAIRDVEPDYLLIGQDGDLGYFINIKNGSEQIYSLDLGALGSLDMDEETMDIYKLKN
ncbi:SMI1/KNR4 family protein [Mangrovibacter plantisponsor]|uniref:Knr4/Smi1-like domain-containing protein n=1 Tax=Mangrovibacter plantisponsor TaxID=451513 RepID=A0A317PJ74_9ENTR|nr:SMI1/KNR4 family protein [Mangrovibacter plantisponsor]PWV99398.1 hypothetical protein DES37_1344 [Mangrovibacter plantisponsor]